MTRFLLSASAAALVAALPHAAQAQAELELDEITVFANQTPTEIDRSGATVDVITEDELEAAGDIRLSDFLNRRAGVSVFSNGPVGARTNLAIRGLPGRYVEVRIDGIDVSDPSSPAADTDFGRLNTSNIQRIEILKGSQSALFGSSAVAGVINITTKRATEPGTTAEVALEYGSYDTFRGAASVSTLTDRAELSFGISRVQSDGFSAAEENDGNTEADGHESTRLTFSGAVQATETLRLGLSGFYEDSLTDTDASGGVGGDSDIPESDVESWGLRAFAELTTGAVDHSFAISTFRIDRAETTSFGTSESEGERLTAAYRGTTELNARTTLSFGADYTEESFDGSAEGDRDIIGVFGEALFAPNDQTDIAVSLRGDEYSDFGSFVSGRLAVAYRPSDQLVLRGTLANGFRAPTLFDINSPSFGNPDLDPETSWGAELGAEYLLAGGGRIGATLFYTEITDLIGFDPTTFQSIQVAGTSVSQGIELSAAVPVTDQVELFGNFTYTDAEDGNGDRFVRVPETDLVVGATADLTDRFSATATVQSVTGLQDRAFGTGLFDLDDYILANVNVSYAVTDSVEAYLRVENLFDEEYQTVSGFGTSDRAFYAGLRASF